MLRLPLGGGGVLAAAVLDVMADVEGKWWETGADGADRRAGLGRYV